MPQTQLRTEYRSSPVPCVCSREHSISTLLTSFAYANRRWNTRCDQTMYHLWPTLCTRRAHSALKQHSQRQDYSVQNTYNNNNNHKLSLKRFHFGLVVKRGRCRSVAPCWVRRSIRSIISHHSWPMRLAGEMSVTSFAQHWTFWDSQLNYDTLE